MREAVNSEDAPSAERGWLDWLLDCGVPGITGVDTRALVRHIREAGAMLGGVFPGAMPEDEAARADRRGAADDRPRPRPRGRRRASRRSIQGDGSGPRIVALDTGIKTSIVRHFVARGATLELLPVHDAGRGGAARGAPTASSSSPARATRPTLGYLVDTVRQAIGRMPVFGICLGHQMLSQAVGLETFKLPFGHRGGNHPVKDLRTGRIAITGAEPRLRRARRGRAAAADRLRRGRAHPREPLRRHDRGHPPARRPGRLRPVPPGGGPGPARLGRAVRRVHRRDRGACRASATTSTRSSSSARARS